MNKPMNDGESHRKENLFPTDISKFSFGLFSPRAEWRKYSLTIYLKAHGSYRF